MAKLSLHKCMIAAITCLLLVFAACSNSESDFATRPSDDSSSSVCKDCNDVSSSSVNSSSSSAESSSSIAPKSNDSETSVSSSGANSSSSSAIWKTAWNYLNPDIDYQEFVDDRDGQTYKFVRIGDHWWMAENLNFEVDSSFCYKDSAEYCEKYGRLYKWEVADHVCPSGWYLPTLGIMYTELFYVVKDSSIAGRVLKSTTGWEPDDPDVFFRGNGTDDFGFSAIPAGVRYFNGEYWNEGGYVTFWTSTESYYNSDYMFELDLSQMYDVAALGSEYKENAVSIRCVKNAL